MRSDLPNVKGEPVVQRAPVAFISGSRSAFFFAFRKKLLKMGSFSASWTGGLTALEKEKRALGFRNTQLCILS